LDDPIIEKGHKKAGPEAALLEMALVPIAPFCRVHGRLKPASMDWFDQDAVKISSWLFQSYSA
jgi:hypothetical protein